MFSQSTNTRGVGCSTDNSATPLTDKYTSGTGSTDNDFPLKAYVTIVQERHEGKGNNATWNCNYCNISYKGSYFRIRCHLLREKKKG